VGRDDLDADGVIDCWSTDYDGGTGFGGVTLTIRRGCKSPAITVSTYGSFAEFLQPVLLPREVAADPKLIDGIIAVLFGADREVTEATADASMRWLLDEARYWRRRDRRRSARQIISRFQRGTPRLPDSQVVRVAGLEAEQLMETLLVDEIELEKPVVALVAYHAHNHHKLERAGRCGDGATIWTTDHGVAIQEGEGWWWAYINTGEDKLRHPSIVRVACDDQLIVIERHWPGGVLIVRGRNPDDGFIARELHRTWELDRGVLTVDSDQVRSEDLRHDINRMTM
jgi:hypothetical protein